MSIQHWVTRPAVEVRLKRGDALVCFGVAKEPSLGARPLAPGAAPPLGLPAALFLRIDPAGQPTEQAGLPGIDPATVLEFEALFPDGRSPFAGVDSSPTPLRLPGLWLHGVSEQRANELQETSGLGPGLWVRQDGWVLPLGSSLLEPLFLKRLPRVLLEPSELVADNTDASVSMGSLLEGFIQQFSTPEHALPHVRIATGYLYARGLMRVLDLLKNPKIQTLHLLFSGKTDRQTAAALTAGLEEQLQEGAEAADRGGWVALQQAVQEGRLRVRVYPDAFLHAKLFLAFNQLDAHQRLMISRAVVGSSNISASGLSERGNLELNVTLEQRDQNTLLWRWFSGRWEEGCEPEPALLEILERQAPPEDPQLVTPGLDQVYQTGQQGKLADARLHLAMLAALLAEQLEGLESLADVAFPEVPGRQLSPTHEQQIGMQALVGRLQRARIAFLADSVGLGKTVTAIGTAWHMRRAGLARKIALVAPQKLHEQWLLDARRVGAPDDLFEFVNRHLLERREAADAQAQLAEYDLIVVEEAHEALRSRANKLWKHLREHLQNNRGCRVLMISATPWNNRREDIFNYLLVAWNEGPLLRDQYPELASTLMMQALGYFSTPPAGSLPAAVAVRWFDQLPLGHYRQIFDRVFVQRTRSSLAQRYQQAVSFPERVVQSHEVSGSSPPDEHDQLFARLKEALEQLFVPYREPFDALQLALSKIRQQESPPGSNLRRSFLIQIYKRAESSLFALAVSLATIERRLDEFEQTLETILSSDAPHAQLEGWLSTVYTRLQEGDDEHESVLSSSEKVRLRNAQGLLSSLDDGETIRLLQSVIDDQIAHDRELVRALRASIPLSLERSSPKDLLLDPVARRAFDAGHKPILIAGFADTALRAFLRLIAQCPDARVGLALGGDEAWVSLPSDQRTPLTQPEWAHSLTLIPQERREFLLAQPRRASRHERELVLAAFAPLARQTPQSRIDRFGGPIDILIGSEAIGVGQNLQDSSCLIHLDMPWNPMVLEQRIGRIDRRGGGRPDPDHEGRRVVDIHYCWSASAVEQEVALRERLRQKAEGAVNDTNFDELLLHEVSAHIAAVRAARAGSQGFAGEEQAIRDLLDRKQRALVEQQEQVPGVQAGAGSELDALRLLAGFRQDHPDLVAPSPTLAAAIVAHDGPVESGGWLLTVAVSPRSSSGEPLGIKPILHHLVIQPEQEQLPQDDLEIVVRQLYRGGPHRGRPGVSRGRWAHALQRLDQLLQRWAERLVSEHNDEVRQRTRAQQSPAAQRSPSERLRRLALEASDRLGAEVPLAARDHREKIKPIARQIKFLLQEVLDPQRIHVLMGEQDERTIEQDLLFIRDFTRAFLLESFGEIFERLGARRWSPDEAAQPPQLSLIEATNDLWARADLRVLAATWVVELGRPEQLPWRVARSRVRCASMAPIDAASELRKALSDETSLRAWLATRGYTPAATAPEPPRRKDLQGATHHLAAGQPRAPRFLVLWRKDMTERSVNGSHLRLIQREANNYRNTLRSAGSTADTPDLFLLGCPDFLLLFPLDGDPFSRRMRFAPDRLPRGTRVEERYLRFSAASLAGLAKDPGSGDQATDSASSGDLDDLDDLLGFVRQSSARLSWAWEDFFVGAQLDENFVAFMSDERARITRLLLLDDNRASLLKPIFHVLRPRGGELPPIADLLNDKDLRASLIATADTVLLRLVLYRYLEVQFGYASTSQDEQKLALGTSYDELLRHSVRDPGKLTALIRRINKSHNQPRPQQQNLFDEPASEGGKGGRAGKGSKGAKAGKGPEASDAAPPTGKPASIPPPSLNDPKAFAGELHSRAERYQSVSGGDLHQGRIAEAADILQGFLEEKHSSEFVRLLAGTSTDEYTFHYADLDPRAFQEFYQRTIGTDIRMHYDPKSHEISVGVVEHEKNRKEQGAYYTDEKTCAWLVRRTLGLRLDRWLRQLHEAIHKTPAAQRRPRVRALLAEMMGWKILDPTCGGGIFLREAFAILSRYRETIVDQLGALSPEALAAITDEAPFKVWRKDAEPGEWEWHVLLHMLHGVDVDVKAVNVASNLLTLSALSYKPNGLCFPSFVNVSLKQGNALINPLRPAEREPRLLKNYRSELVTLLSLREKLRDPGLDRALWKQLHQQADQITRALTEALAVLAYKDLFPEFEGDDAQLLERIQQVGLFCYEVEFPEVFFELAPRKARGKPELGLALEGVDEPTADLAVQLRKRPGFDFILGNPPWEEPAAELKHFLPDYDPAFRELKGKEAERREKELLADAHILERWVAFQHSIDDYKKLLTAGWYEHQQRKVKGEFQGAHSNLYKYAVEMSWQLLVDGGMAGLVTDGGLWSDLASNGLRRLLLEQSFTHAVAGFTNTEGLFPDIDGRMKFCLNVFERGSKTETLRAVFMLRLLEELELFDSSAASISVEQIRTDPRDSYPVSEVRSQAHWEAEQKMLHFPMLEDAPWSIDIYSRELNAGEQRKFFHAPRKGYLPLIQGTQFNLFGVHQGGLPEFWLDPGPKGAGGFLRERQEGRILKAIADWLDAQGKLKGGKETAAMAWVRALTGKAELPDSWVRLDWDGYRLAWRDITNGTNQRTIICSLLPRKVGVSDTAPFVRPFRLEIAEKGVQWKLQYPMEVLLYLAGVLSSFAADSIARTRLAKTHLKPHLFKSFPVPPWKGTAGQRRIAELVARLTCVPVTEERPWADYGDLAAAVGLSPERDGLVEAGERWSAEVELNALAAQEYGLEAKDLGYLMGLLFLTKAHREEHLRMKQDITVRMEHQAELATPREDRGPPAREVLALMRPYKKPPSDEAIREMLAERGRRAK